MGQRLPVPAGYFIKAENYESVLWIRIQLQIQYKY